MFLTFILLLFVAVILWVISIIFNDIEDGVQFYHDESIFDWLPKNGWWSWYMMDPDYTWKRKYNEDGSRKKWFGIIVKPAFVFDGWHGAKFIRQFFQYLTAFTTFCAGYILATMQIEMTLQIWSWFFFGGLIIFGVTNFLTHEVYVFKGMIRKEWWIKRGLEEKVKIFLDKWF